MALITVLGAGSWGTALAILLADKSAHQVRLWEFRPDAAKRLAEDRENKEFLPGTPFPYSLEVTNDLNAALEGAEAVLVVVPSQFVRSVLVQIEGDHSDKIWLNAAKGIELDSLKRMSEVVEEVMGPEMLDRYVVLSGPSHAEEVIRGLPTTVVAAARDINLSQQVQQWFSGPTFRVYASQDVVGVELGGAIKNVIAIASGICDGLGFGDNTRGALLTRGIAEMARLGTSMGGQFETFSGLSGIGDLITTCVSKHSRNRYVGEEIGKGRSLDEILDSMHMVAEGVVTTKSAYNLSRKLDVDMPITQQVYSVLFEGVPPREAVMKLMMRSLKVEHG